VVLSLKAPQWSAIIQTKLMDALKRHRLSRRRYRGHLTKIITTSRDIIDKDSSEHMETDITSLTDWQKQLNHKKEVLSDVDSKIINLIEEEGELESEVLETEEILVESEILGRGEVTP